MFVENIKRLHNKKFSHAITKVIETINSTDFENLADGKYDIEDKKIFYIVARGKTKNLSDAKAEAHEFYADIQYIHSGSEVIQWSNNHKKFTISDPYDSERDLKFYEDNNEELSDVKLFAGDLMYIHPEEVHKPSCNINGKQQEVLKVVFKIHLDSL